MAKTGDAPGRGPRRPGLAVINGFAGRRSVIPFAVLVLAVLSVGLVGLLLLNTAIDRGAFEIQAAQKRQSQLTDQQQQLQLRLNNLSAPGPLASQAAALGMVPNPQPAFLNPANGAVLGTPSPAPTTAPPSPSPSASPSGTATALTSAPPSPSTSTTGGTP
jgi:hypothetical protein